jgi:hypothetical protein
MLQQAERKLRETVDAIVRLLADDLAGYPARELRRRFVGSDGADQLSVAELAELRQVSRDLGATHVLRIEKELAFPGPWMLSVMQLPTAPGDVRGKPALTDLPLVWQVVSRIDADVETAAARYGLPGDDRSPLGYTPPARFIDRQYLPTLTEKLVKGLQEVGELQGKLDLEVAEQRRLARAARWDAP